MINIDNHEKQKFDAQASDWWDRSGPFKTLHDINPLRVNYVDKIAGLSGMKVLDVGCGGGILAEAMAEKGAKVTGIDISKAGIDVAREHVRLKQNEINYELASPEEYCSQHTGYFDTITCMEMLEHVPDPVSVISACASMLKPGGHAFFSTINRSVISFLNAKVAAEYLFRLIPVGTHQYANFIRPSELANWCEKHQLFVKDIAGIIYIPIIGQAFLGKTPNVNYFLYAQKK